MRYSLVFAPRAIDDLEKIKKSGNKAKLKKLRAVLEELKSILVRVSVTLNN